MFIVNLSSIKYSSLKCKANQMYFLRGGFWADGEYLDGLDGVRYLSDKHEPHSSLHESFVPGNGNFSYVIKSRENIFAAVDRVRSMPLYYAYNAKEFFISDDAKWVLEQIKVEINKDALVEFRHTGFVTGSETLYSGLFQLQAGECLAVNSRDNKIVIEKRRYFRYECKNILHEPTGELLSKVDNVFISAFRRLVASARGRTLVVPLSGGYDSRFILVMLKKLNYSNVLCYTYGKANYHECAIAQKTASKLGYRCVYIQYTRQIWKQTFRDEKFRSFFQAADGLCSLPHIDDWPAIKYLNDHNILPADAVIVPGHTGDFIAGGHINPNIPSCKNVDKDTLIAYIIKKHYRLHDFSGLEKTTQARMKRRIIDRLHIDEISSVEDLGFAIEMFDWQERQSKFIVNALRLYEFFGYEWRIPFWDSELLNLWQRIPLKQKIRKKLYIEYLTQYSDIFEDKVLKDASVKAQLSKIGMIRNMSRFFHLFRNEFKPLYRRLFEYHMNRLQCFGAYGYIGLLFKPEGFMNINSLLVDDYLKNIRLDQNA